MLTEEGKVNLPIKLIHSSGKQYVNVINGRWPVIKWTFQPHRSRKSSRIEIRVVHHLPGEQQPTSLSFAQGTANYRAFEEGKSMNESWRGTVFVVAVGVAKEGIRGDFN